ncbi:DUF2798 domain-containing protein [Ferrimonas sp. YFM]|uniref:DUF2798 domain-containing protein n=1 Tax=Ferrimonas sp. YFM TaxID=3028878 RepID=UPI0025725660|nr:DUF2798 domain-containing protein [Ferrimonas sp. YFM]BDY06544.1 hypothetical protein F0521_35850 [Ferrimonas sp. YFM]
MNRPKLLITALLGSFTMGLIMSAALTTIHTGFDANWTLRWGESFLMAWPLAFLLSLTVMPRVAELAGSLISEPVRRTK